MKSALIAATLVAFALPVLAQTTPRVDQRQTNQESRIDKGVASGTLNDKEAARLEKGQAHVQSVEDKAKADGVVTDKEKAHLHHAQEKQSRRIYKQKHDAQVKPPVEPVPAVAPAK
ncbi:hypothetical protein BWI17_00875 [Betaproteobacteria bacterium GR16-43]|nr:hypothetical protein BWI17_00875 [Betaproteobacteria bacterium GR16-43]